MSKVLREAVKVSYEYPEVAIPDKPSELIREVVEDMRQVGKLPHVIFDMDAWCQKEGDRRCSVCAAGAWMYAKANFPRDSENMERIAEFIEDMSSNEVHDIMSAIDDLRIKSLECSLYSLDREYSFPDNIDTDAIVVELQNCFPSTYNSENAQSVMAAFMKCAKVLESHGL